MNAVLGGGAAPLVLTEAEVAERLTLADATVWVERAFAGLGRGAGGAVPRSRISLPDGVFHWLSGHLTSEGLVGSKLYTTIRDGERERRSSCLVAFDANAGARVATIESYQLSLVRTAACTAVATRYLARPDAAVLAMIGTGSTAYLQVASVLAERPFGQVLVHSRTAANRQVLAREITDQLGVPADPVDTAEAAVRPADVVITATDTRDPIVAASWLRPGVLVNAIGSNYPDRRELAPQVLAGAERIYADAVEPVRVEGGDLVLAVAEGALTWDRVAPIGPLVATGRPAPPVPGWTVFKSVGIAPLDLAMVACLRAGAGTTGEDA